MEQEQAAGFRCSTSARDRADPMLGTAPPARRWLLLEQSTRWLPQAYAGMRLDPVVRAAVTAAADATLTRILLIRRHGRHTPPQPEPETGRAWFVVDPLSPTPVRRGTWHSDADLLAAAGHLRHAAMGPLRDAGHAVGATTPVAELLLVCTHGRHDVCCAVRGRPVVASLAARWPEQTWECSHVGGDRFAANVLSLPDGAMFGGLDVDTAVEVLERHRAGRTDLTRLRGICGHSPVVQAAMAAVYDAAAPVTWADLRPVRVHGPSRDSRGWAAQVEVTSQGLVYAVRGREVVRPPHRLTCQTLEAHRATAHVVESVQAVEPVPRAGERG